MWRENSFPFIGISYNVVIFVSRKIYVFIFIGKYVEMIYIWLYILSIYADINCSKKVNIYLYLTHFKKKLAREGEILKPENINTAYTNGGCKHHGEIVIYRKEEWFKVFIHETFHNFGLDFSHKNIDILQNKMKTIFKIDSDYNIFETYCETWARIMNCLITSFLILDNKKNKKLYLEYSNIFLQCERIFSLLQSEKMLQHYKITFDELYNPKISIQFKEETNVFAYYILTGSLMNNYVSFIEWCEEYNKNYFQFDTTERNIMSFGNLIIKLMNEEKNGNENECINNNSNNINRKMARMSIIEL